MNAVNAAVAPAATARAWRAVVTVAAVLGLGLAACQAPRSLPPQATTDQPAVEASTAPAAEADAPADGEPRAVIADVDAPSLEPAASDAEVDLAALDSGRAPDVEIDVDVVRPTIRVGLLLPLSGRAAPEGRALLDAAQLALFDVADERFALLPRDTRGTEAGAAEAALALLDEGVTLILGPLFSSNVNAVAPLTRARGVNLIAFSTDESVAGGGVYLLGHTSSQQVARIVSFAAEQGLTRLAVLAPDSRYGRSVAAELAEATYAAGLSLVRSAFYAADASDAADVVRSLAAYDQRKQALSAERRALAARDDEASRRALKRLATLDTFGEVAFDALVLADGGARLRQVVPLLPFYDVDPEKVRFIGTGLWADPDTIREPTLTGGWFVGSPPSARAGFETRYRAAYGGGPQRIATLAYDATALAAALAGAGRDFDAAALGDRRGFLGTDGIFRFDSAGLAERGLAMFEIVRPGETRIVSPAPGRFDVAARADRSADPAAGAQDDGTGGVGEATGARAADGTLQ